MPAREGTLRGLDPQRVSSAHSAVVYEVSLSLGSLSLRISPASQWLCDSASLGNLNLVKIYFYAHHSLIQQTLFSRFESPISYSALAQLHRSSVSPFPTAHRNRKKRNVDARGCRSPRVVPRHETKTKNVFSSSEPCCPNTHNPQNPRCQLTHAHAHAGYVFLCPPVEPS